MAVKVGVQIAQRAEAGKNKAEAINSLSQTGFDFKNPNRIFAL